jgi:hypothetical protein
MAAFLEEATKKKITLLIIDPQNDFHPGGKIYPGSSLSSIVGSLGVPGAIEDSERTASFIRQHINEIDEIYVSLDSHHVRAEQMIVDDYPCLEIAHCSWGILEEF